MNIRMLGILILLLSMTFVLGIDGCNRKTQDSRLKTQDEAGVSESILPAQKPNPSAKTDSDESKDYKPKQSLSAQEYGRENPFAPLMAESRGGRTTDRITNSVSKAVRSEVAQAEKKEKRTTISLTAVLGDAAIFEESGASRSVSVGDTIAGMEVLDIRNNEVLLSKEDKKYRMTMGAQLVVTTRMDK